MIARTLLGLSSLILILSVGSAAVCQEAKSKLPSADEVIEQHILATGGFELLSSISSMHLAWEAEKPGVSWRYEAWQMPGRVFAEMSTNGVVEHHDGSWVADSRGDWSNLRGVAWRQYLRQGMTTMHTGQALQSELMSAYVMVGSLKWRERYKSVRCVGIEEIDGMQCYHLKYIELDDQKMDRYFDVESGYLIYQKKIDLKMRGSLVTRTYSDHDRVGDVVVAKTQKIECDGKTYVWKIETFEYDEEVDTDRFFIPDEVRLAINELNSQPEIAQEDLSK